MFQVCVYNLSRLNAVTDFEKLLPTSPVYVRKEGFILQSKHFLISKDPTAILTLICNVGRWDYLERGDHTHKPSFAPANIIWKMTYLETTMPFTWRNLNRSCAFSRSLNFSLAVKVSYGTKRGWLPPPGARKARDDNIFGSSFAFLGKHTSPPAHLLGRCWEPDLPLLSSSSFFFLAQILW